MSTSRAHISWKTKYAAALCRWGGIPYVDAKQMSEDQIISLFHIDHNIHHESGHPNRDKFWNLTPMRIREHREKTKTDAKIISKGRRIRRKEYLVEINREMRELARENPDRALLEAFRKGIYDGRQQANDAWSKEASRPGGALRWATPDAVRIKAPPLLGTVEEQTAWRRRAADMVIAKARNRLQSRGFPKTQTRHFDGSVTRRKTHGKKTPRKRT